MAYDNQPYYQEARDFFDKTFGKYPEHHVPYGVYAIPQADGRFMRVKVTHDGEFSHYDLWWNEQLTKSCWKYNKDGSLKDIKYAADVYSDPIRCSRCGRVFDTSYDYMVHNTTGKCTAKQPLN